MLAGSSLLIVLPSSWLVAVVMTVSGTGEKEHLKHGSGRVRDESLGDREGAILWGLHVARAMSTPQIAVELFPGQQACKARISLNWLRQMGLVERHRGGLPAGSEAYLWSLTRKGFERLREWGAQARFGAYEEDPELRLLPAKAKFRPWAWAEERWYAELPGRIVHDLKTIDFLISYRRLVDATLASQAGYGCALSEWRCEHAFLPPLDENDPLGERRPVTVYGASKRAFSRYRYVRERAWVGGFPQGARLQVVKPDGALSIVLTDTEPGWRSMIEPPPWQPPVLFDAESWPPPAIDVLVEYDRTGRPSENVEKLEGLDMFLNVGLHLVARTPVICLQGSEREGYGAEVVVLFVCPPGKARTMMAGADRVLTGHVQRDMEVSYEGRQRIVFCEADGFGDLVADLRERERWLRIPADRRPAPPKPIPGSRQMWRLAELPPPSSRQRNRGMAATGEGGERFAPVREREELTIRAWEHPAMIEMLGRGA